MILHIVLFEPKAALQGSDMRSFAKTVADTCSSLPMIRTATVGRRADVDAGYDRSFGDNTYKYAAILGFDRRQDLIAYLNHPSHAELGRLFWLNCERTVVSEVETVDLADPDFADKLVQ